MPRGGKATLLAHPIHTNCRGGASLGVLTALCLLAELYGGHSEGSVGHPRLTAIKDVGGTVNVARWLWPSVSTVRSSCVGRGLFKRKYRGLAAECRNVGLNFSAAEVRKLETAGGQFLVCKLKY